VAGFGMHVTLIEPGGFSTDWAGPSSRYATALDAYVRQRANQWRATRNASPGDPSASSVAVLAVVDAELPPLRIFLGNAPLELAEQDYESRLATWREWQDVSNAAQGG
jgi:hypothetical protein